MIEELEKVINILEQKTFDYVIVEVKPENRSALLRVVQNYIKNEFTNYKAWQEDIESGQLGHINYLFFSMNGKDRGSFKMLRQKSSYQEKDGELFLTSEIFFNSKKYKKKKLEI